jgi:thioredoxin 1
MAVLEVADAESFEREVLRSDGPTVVAFWAEWCPFCRRFRPLFEKASSERGGRFAFVRLDENDNPLWERYAVAVVPSVAVFRGGAVAARKDGVLGRGISAEVLAAFLDQALPASAPT